MKKLLGTILVLVVAFGAKAVDRLSLDQKANTLLAKFELMQEKPDKRVPPQFLRKARAIILLDRTKAGFVFAYQGGGGVALVKDKRGRWSPLAFMKADEASLGFQIGAQQSFVVILLMNEESARTLIADAAFEFGGEARGTAGDVSEGVEGKVDDIERAVLVFNDREGLFGGAAVKGGAISPDQTANCVYYGQPVTMEDILFKRKVKLSEAAVTLGRKLDHYARER